jgi:hypothetical protein
METTERIERLERRVRTLTAALILVSAGFVVVNLRAQAGVADHLRVRQISVVDERGTDRVWIGAPVPDPIILGERHKRAGAMAGMIVLDHKGNERGGFGTSDSGDVWLGLDSEKEQQVRLAVNPGGGSHLTLYDSDKNSARIGIWPDHPTLVLRHKGTTVFEQPLLK